MPKRTRDSLAVLIALSVGLGAAPAATAVDAWPLYQRDEAGTTVFYPLYVHEGDFLMVAPLYTRTNQGRDHHLLWPVVKVSDGRLERLAPFYFSDHDQEFTLLPLIRQTQRGTFWALPPSYFSRSADAKSTLVFPLYGDFRDGEERTTWVGPWYRQREPLVRKHGVLPLYTHAEEQSVWRGETEHSLSLLAWLYARSTTTDAAGQRIAHHRRFLVLTDSLDESGARTLGLFGLPVWERVSASDTREG